MTQTERNSRERIQTVLLITLLIAVGVLGYDRIANPDLQSTSDDVPPTTEPSPESTIAPTATPRADVLATAVALSPELADLLATLEIDGVAIFPELETPSLLGTKGLEIQSFDDLLAQYDVLAQVAEVNLDYLFEQSPSARIYFADPVFGGFTSWTDELTGEQALSLGFDTVLSDPEGRSGMGDAQALLNRSFTMRTINGEPTEVFIQQPGLIDFRGLWVADPSGETNHLWSAPVTSNFEYAQKAFFSQVIGLAQRYSDMHNLNWDAADFEYVARIVVGNYNDGIFDVIDGYEPISYLHRGSNTRSQAYILNDAVGTRRYQAQPDNTGPGYDDRADQDIRPVCIVVRPHEPGEAIDFPAELDGNDSWQPLAVVNDLTTAPDNLGPDGFAQWLTTGTGKVSVRFRSTSTDARPDNVPDAYFDDAYASDLDHIVGGECAPGPVFGLPTATFQSPGQEMTPQPPVDTPPPPTEPPRTPQPTPEKSDNTDRDGDGGYQGGPIDTGGPIDQPQPTPQPLPTTNPAEATPPSF